MVRQDLMNAANATKGKFDFAVATASDAPSFAYSPWPEGEQAIEIATHRSNSPDLGTKGPSQLVSMKRPHQPDTQTQQSIVSRYEALVSLAVVIGARQDVDGLFAALSAELPRVVNFDFIGLSKYDHEASRVDWRLCRRHGRIETDVIDGMKEGAISAWISSGERRRHSFLSRETVR
jgi:hypothetical protein